MASTFSIVSIFVLASNCCACFYQFDCWLYHLVFFYLLHFQIHLTSPIVPIYIQLPDTLETDKVPLSAVPLIEAACPVKEPERQLYATCFMGQSLGLLHTHPHGTEPSVLLRRDVIQDAVKDAALPCAAQHAQQQHNAYHEVDPRRICAHDVFDVL